MALEVPPLSDDAMTAAYERLSRRHGKLDGLAVWIAGAQGVVPPKPLRRKRVVVFGDTPVDGDVRGAGTWDDGVALADREVDAGADVFGVTARAMPGVTAVVAALADAEPVEVAAPGAGWAREVAEVRDALRSHRSSSPVELADALGIGAIAGFVAGAARRRTPVVLDGLAPCAAALVAAKVAPLAVTYLCAGHVTPHPAHAVALRALGLEPLLDLGIRADGGGLLAFAILDAAVALLDERA